VKFRFDLIFLLLNRLWMSMKVNHIKVVIQNSNHRFKVKIPRWRGFAIRAPVEEGLVFNPEDYVYSSAVNYAGGKGLLEVTLLS